MRRDAAHVIEPGTDLARPWGPAWSPRAVIAALEPLVRPERAARIREVVAQRLASVTVCLDAPHDPHNGAAVLRSCDAFGVTTVHVVPSHEPFFVSGLVAKGAQRWVDVVVHDGPESALATFRARGFAIVATHPAGRLVPEDLAGLDRVAIVLGNERDGIRGAMAAGATDTVRVPMRGFVESLNVSVTAAVLLAAATARRPGDLDPDERDLRYASGLFQTVPRAAEVLEALGPPASPAGG